MSENPTIDQLVQVPICKGLSKPEVEVLFAIAAEQRVARGQAVFHEGEAGNGLYVLLEGEVEIRKADKAGEGQTLATLGAGSVFGEMSLIDSNAPRSASAIATRDLRLLWISSGRFSELLGRNDVAALKITLNLAQVLSRRLGQMTEKVVDLIDKTRKREEFADFQRVLTSWSF